MRILDLQPVSGNGDRATRLVATFDLELDDSVRMFGLKLMETPDGRRLTYAPSANGGRRTATFSPSMAAQITAAATTKLEGHETADGKNQNQA